MKLRLILADQLNAEHSWYKEKESATLYCMMEVRSETDYALHHVQKITALFLAFRNFAGQLQKAGKSILYLRLDDHRNRQSFTENLRWIIAEYAAEKIEYQLPDEFRLDTEFSCWEREFNLPVQAYDTEHFLQERYAVKQFFQGKKTFLMESFYRNMRKQYHLLMDGKEPLGGRWNFDAENRKSYPKKMRAPPILEFHHDVSEITDMLVSCNVKTIGSLPGQVSIWPSDRTESLQLLEFFAEHLLPRFGEYQDAMHTEIWAGYHSRLSFAMNTKMLHPLEVVQHCLSKWRKRSEDISLAQIEGFTRQIIGWREYMRGIYWATMPEYRTLNYFQNTNALPHWFWSGETRMNCLRYTIRQSLEKGYAHHIQRLMVTGNFALLAGIHPDAVDEWYLGIYVDAYEWVEITNTRGMSQFADGGIVGSKPYVSTANYIKKMSNYCDECHYREKERTGEGSCPFNSLYWNFYFRNREKLSSNPRIGMMYRVWDKMQPDIQESILEQAQNYLERLETL